MKFEAWVKAVFETKSDHEMPVLTARGALAHVTRLLAAPQILIGRYDADAIGRGIGRIASPSFSDFMFAALDESLPWADRLRCIESIATLYENLFAKVCAEDLSHVLRGAEGERKLSRANGICYMFWDVAPMHAEPRKKSARRKDEACLEVMKRTLAIPHVACEEGSLHGLGHWAYEYPDEVARIIDAWAAGPRARRVPAALRTYAAQARTGYVH